MEKLDPLLAIRGTFFLECEEQLAALEEGLMVMEGGDASLEVINAVFRAVHSVKGGAGAFKLHALVSFAHGFETVLDELRNGRLAADHAVLRLLLRAADVLADLVAQARDNMATDPASYAALQKELEDILPAPAEEGADDVDFNIDFTPTLIDVAPLPEQPTALTLQFRPYPGLFDKANEPLLLFRELARRGSLECRCDASRVPPLDAFDVAACYLDFTLNFTGKDARATINDVFEFVEGDCALTMTEPAPESIRIEMAAPPPAPAPEIAPVPEAPPAPSQGEAAAVSAPKAAPSSTIRVELERVDRLINLVGELVINQAMLALRIGQLQQAADSGISASLEELGHLTRNLQDSVMAIRAQPVKSLFQRMARIVREVSESTGKQVRLKCEGEATEVDKTVVESLADPLTHMIRNAIDHGLEAPDQRLAAGKPAEGLLLLSAAHQSGKVVITVKDDGAGINRARVLQIARQKGLVPPDAQLSDAEIDNLLFLPGFSTAATVSSISGRGVGMDVVRRSIQALGGRISIASIPGQGATFTLSLPLTLAVLDGVVVTLAGETFIVPLTAVVETLRPDRANLLPMGHGMFALRVREQLIPLVDVGIELSLRERLTQPENCIAMVVETEGQRRSAILVDRIEDQRQVVIKSLEANYGPVTGVAAATILGDGRVAMILDIDQLVLGAASAHRTPPHRLALAS